MKILSFEIHGLLGRSATVSAKFGPDLNILTGRNGAGKTSVLKLLWYVISGNIEVALQEIPFSKATITTDVYEITIFSLGSNTCKVELKMNGESRLYEDHEGDDFWVDAEDRPNEILQTMGHSIFLPTFRRIEGGYTLGQRPRQARVARTKNDIEDGLVALSAKLTNGPHAFVAAISTVDIVSLLLRYYGDYSQEANGLQQSVSHEIIENIKAFKRQTDSPEQPDADRVIEEIRIKILRMEAAREEIMRPIAAIEELVKRMITHTGIKISARLSFGDATKAVNSDALSAGEKQMLSFICYNAFNSDAILFIDEPELSLHVDWQRQLFPTLLQQQAKNQFIVATHSPFIYSKYPDKEVCLDTDRGDTEQ